MTEVKTARLIKATTDKRAAYQALHITPLRFVIPSEVQWYADSITPSYASRRFTMNQHTVYFEW